MTAAGLEAAMRPMSASEPLWRHVAPVVMVAVTLVGSACGDDGADTVSTTVQVTGDVEGGAEATDTSGDEAALGAAVDDLAGACGDQDRDRLRDLSGAGARDRIRDRDQLFTEVDELRVVEREVNLDGDTATVTVTLEVTMDGDTSQVERVWTYERIDGEWLLSEVPDCVFS